MHNGRKRAFNHYYYTAKLEHPGAEQVLTPEEIDQFRVEHIA